MKKETLHVGDVNFTETKSSKKVTHYEFKVRHRFVLEALRSVGYDAYSCIYELVDNAIDAGASKIKILYNQELNSLIISDNGSGMSFKKLQSSMDMGCEREYDSGEIGYFGAGLKTSCLNIIDIDNLPCVIEVTTFDGIETSHLRWEPTLNPFGIDQKYLEINPSEKGTKIKIQNVTKKLSSKILKKNLAVIFHPTLKDGRVEIFVDNDKVIPNDPLYRDDELVITDFTDATVRQSQSNKLDEGPEFKIDIKVSMLNKIQNRHAWDGTTKKTWSYEKGGIYCIYGGRYIETGGMLGIKTDDPWDSTTRVEFTIPKELTETFEIKFNKTHGIKTLRQSNKQLEELRMKLLSMFAWAKKKRKDLKLEKSLISEDEQEEFKEIEKSLNKSANKARIRLPKSNKKTQQESKEKFHVEPEPSKNGNSIEKTKAPVTKAKITDRKFYALKTQNFSDATDKFWHLGYENNMFTITLNESHIFFKEIYKGMDSDGRRDMMYVLASMAHAQYELLYRYSNVAEEEEENANQEHFWQQYWSLVSLQMTQLLSH